MKIENVIIKLIFVIGIFAIGSIVIVYLTPEGEKIKFQQLILQYSNFFMIIVFFVGIVAITIPSLFKYLKPEKSEGVSDELENPDFVFKERSEILRNFNSLQEKIEKIESNNILLNDADRSKITKSIIESFEKDAPKLYLQQIRESVENQVKSSVIDDHRKEITNSVVRLFNRSIDRFNNAIKDQYKRGNLNLIIGIFITVLGLVILWYYVHISKIETQEISIMAANYFPRITLVILIEIFAFFFLKLYKASLDEIKHLHNELTNFELRYLSVYMTLSSSDHNCLMDICKILAFERGNLGKFKDEKDLTDSFDMSKLPTIIEPILKLAKKFEKKS